MSRYHPRAQFQLQGGCIYGSTSCTCYAGAMGGDMHTLGAKRPGGCGVRIGTHDYTGGTTLSQVDYSLNHGWNIDLDVRYSMAWSDFWQRILDGHGAVLQLWYRRIRDSRWRGSTTFYGNHAVFVADATGGSYAGMAYVYDPLADGRYSGIYRGPGWYPASMLRAAAGELRFPSGATVGYGKCYAMFTRDITTSVVKPPPSSPIDYGANTMIVSSGINISSSHRAYMKQGTSLYREPKAGSPRVTRISAAAATQGVRYIGNAASGWKAVGVSTRNFADGESRPVIVYVPSKYIGVVKKVA